ncbi:nitrogen fixation protein NifX [Rhodoplanes sp. TEM]|uniref:Nitrogen fixation protein NifX n=1 Tax=Rhodoplanes tepidamans TaxID=200616 RepID=A0ABT5JFR1_RHOTP|nr:MULTISPECIES: nitrogen fixation protein NifX [Rhodoplanes]MDC7788414.1 nitrogen fixation protein NifX [Rhodoplanes tepidamans]MDC7985913.1 nitrogen fixation protein NifX [Rhodoplanes sp. TEM]MDQ0357087.1 nitrogen fixation protein NifX [Rhodoplanes tepidamans]
MTAIRKLRIIDQDESAPTAPTAAVRVAIATQDRKSLNAHFGSARCFTVYDVTAQGWTHVETITCDTVSDEQGQHQTDGEDRITPKVKALEGCHLLFCIAIGGPSAAKVVAAKIHPIKMPAQPIDAVLERTRVMLNGAPPPWLRKVLASAGVAGEKPSFVDDE